MGSLEIAITEYGTWEVTTSTGGTFRLNDRNGNLEVRVPEGDLVVRPQSANVVELENLAWEAPAPDPAQVWEDGCREGLSTNPGWDEQTLARNPYRQG